MLVSGCDVSISIRETLISLVIIIDSILLFTSHGSVYIFTPKHTTMLTTKHVQTWIATMGFSLLPEMKISALPSEPTVMVAPEHGKSPWFPEMTSQ